MDDEIAELWRQLAINIARCEHGRIAIQRVANAAACRLVVPPREKMNDPRAWYVRLVA
jgi:hypothetical protein